MMSRRASHASSWYSDDPKRLAEELGSWMGAVDVFHAPAKAIIAPHAGYRFCGSCGVHAYKQIDPSGINNVFILGPSHHAAIEGCALPVSQWYDTPFYSIKVNSKIVDELEFSGLFQRVDRKAEEAEHSVEMQLPHIANVFRGYDVQIIPIIVGHLSERSMNGYAKIFTDYFLRPDCIFVISSDFCHWGRKFSYTYYQGDGPIHEFIKGLDEEGMDCIKKLDVRAFESYLRKTENTICGKNPIKILLCVVNEALKVKPELKADLKFLNYKQSNEVTKMNDFSVSYAAASLVVK